MKSENAKRPLAGIRALELAEIWAGPYCGALLSDMGAEVVKVESVQRISRGPIKPSPGAPGYPDGEPGERPWNRSANFNVLNRNKQSITLDLTSTEGVEVFKEFASVSDVVFCNSAFGVMEKFGLGYEELKQVKPDLIVLFMPGYGNTGPYKRIRSMGMSIDAVSGHSSLRGYPDLDLERLSPVHHPDAVGGVMAAFALCAAIHNRARTGKGQFIDISQAEAFVPHLGEVFLEYGLTGEPRERRGNRHPAMAPHGAYPCRGEDAWVAISARNEQEWRDLCQVMGLPQLADDPRFSTLESRLNNADAVDAEIARWTSGRDHREVADILQARGIPAGPVLDCNIDTYDDPHLQHRDYFQTIVHPDAGTHLLSGPMWKSANGSKPRHEPAPGLGQHNNQVLEEVLGFTADKMKSLERENIIGTVPLEGSDMGGVRRVQRGV
ncbi:MAG: CoA transferase [SAR202 cluster bacterium]|jgi:crotonobetainyl-CoA:carnitine CoA-transferase CaiB-like acyl-CoA transferase|nr:CoA transferase [SAR202 cluster bacterium]MDP6512991.1 CoA transferase [SAR202 cluster bacterium]